MTSLYSQSRNASRSLRYRAFSSPRDVSQTGNGTSLLEYSQHPQLAYPSGQMSDVRYGAVPTSYSRRSRSQRVEHAVDDVTRISRDIIGNGGEMGAFEVSDLNATLFQRQSRCQQGDNVVLMGGQLRPDVDVENCRDAYHQYRLPMTRSSPETRLRTNGVMRTPTGSNQNVQTASYFETRPLPGSSASTWSRLYDGIATAAPAVHQDQPVSYAQPKYQHSTAGDTDMMMMMMRRDQQQLQQLQNQQQYHNDQRNTLHRQMERPPVYAVQFATLPPIDDVLFREAAEYVIASRPAASTTSGGFSSKGFSLELNEFLRSVNFGECFRDPSSGWFDSTPAATERHGAQPDERRRFADVPSPVVQQRPVDHQARLIESGCNVPTALLRWPADGDTVSDVGGRSDTEFRDVADRRHTSGLWIGKPKRTSRQRRVIVAPIESGFEEASWCNGCFRHVTSFDQSSVADGRVYHNECLNCCICQRSLKHKPMYISAGLIYCENDYLYVGFQRNIETCSACGNTIVDTKLEAMGKSYHPECFQCNVCGVSLDDSWFTVDVKGRIYCIPDYYRLHAPKCCVCRQHVVPTRDGESTIRLVALDRNYHLSCFRCLDCGTHLSDGHKSFCYPLNNQALCLTCHGRRVQRLSTTSEGSSVTSLTPRRLPLHRNIPQPRDAFVSTTTSDDESYNTRRGDAMTSPPSFPVVDATIDDDQASWASSSGGEVVMTIRRQPPVQRHQEVLHLQQQQQQLPSALTSEDTSSVASSVDHHYDVIGSTKTNERSLLDSHGNGANYTIDEDDCCRYPLNIVDVREHDENDDDIEGQVGTLSEWSSCAGGADSGHCSSPSDDTLASSSEADALVSASGVVQLSSSMIVEATVTEWNESCFSRRRSGVPEVSTDDEEDSEAPEADVMTSSSCRNVAELIARQLNCSDLDFCRVTDL